MDKALRFTTLIFGIVSLLGGARLLQASEDVAQVDTLLPLVGLVIVGLGALGIGALYPRPVWQAYQRGLALLGRHLVLHLVWLGMVIGLWWGLTQFAPRLVIDLFFPLLCLSVLGIVLLGMASPKAFAPLAKLYSGVGFGLLMALLLAEVFLRLVGVPSDSRIGSQMRLFDVYISDEQIGHALRPDSEFVWTNVFGEFTVPVETNALGLRDVPRQYTNPDGVSRVLVLGDSFTEALQVTLDETPTQVMERCLVEHYQRPVEVINGGLSANGTGQRWLYYQAYGRDFAADVVLHTQYPSNDLWDNIGNLGIFADLRGVYSFSVDSAGNLVQSYAPPQRDLVDYLSDSVGLKTAGVLRAIRFINEQDDLTRDQYFDFEFFSADFPANLPAVWQTHQAILRRFAADVQADDAVFGLVIIPNWRAVEPTREASLPDGVDPASLDYAVLHQVIAEDAAEVGIPVLDLRPVALAHYEQADAAPLYWEKDGHFNANGYQLMGQAMCEWVIEAGWLE